MEGGLARERGKTFSAGRQECLVWSRREGSTGTRTHLFTMHKKEGCKKNIKNKKTQKRIRGTSEYDPHLFCSSKALGAPLLARNTSLHEARVY
jgi:hypothetical protein